jgi:6-phospho-3-hexuloisomerase
MHRVKAVSREISRNMVRSLGEIDENRIEKVIDEILKAGKIFVLGVGHSGLIGKVLAMKLAHLGFSSHVVGEVTTPPLKRGDLLVAISQSGETSSVIALVRKVKNLGGRIVAVTSSPQSSLIELAHVSLVVPAKIEGIEFPVLSLLGDREHKNMSGALFGMNLFALFYGLVCELAAKTGQSPQKIDSRHANIE